MLSRTPALLASWQHSGDADAVPVGSLRPRVIPRAWRLVTQAHLIPSTWCSAPQCPAVEDGPYVTLALGAQAASLPGWSVSPVGHGAEGVGGGNRGP